MLLTIYALIVTIGWVGTCIYLLVNARTINYLKNVPPSAPVPHPSVAIVIAVKNEEAEVEAALTSVCKLDYSNYSIIVINDRSTDRTPEILQKMVAANPAIRVITVTDLPAGWLGKNHALYQGYLASTEEWLLFTDADVKYSRQTLQKAINYATTHHLDHLTALPEVNSRSAIFSSVMNTFAIMLEIRLQPWRVSNPKSKASIGIGAFNLMKRKAYEKAGTHKVISLRPDDDLKLGQRIKQAGLRQQVVYGYNEIWLEWYTSLGEFINGLMKNTFSVSNYNLLLAIGSALLTCFVFVLPIPVSVLGGQNGLLMAAIILLAQVIIMRFMKGLQGKWWHALMIPFAGAVMMYILIKSAFKTLQQGGIYWRGSFYPLKELRKQR